MIIPNGQSSQQFAARFAARLKTGPDPAKQATNATLVDFKVRPTSWELTKTGKVSPSPHPLIDALRAQALAGGGIVGVEGSHPGFSIAKKAGAALDLNLGGKNLPDLRIVGIAPGARIGQIEVAQLCGFPGVLGLEDLEVESTAINKFCVLFDQHQGPDYASKGIARQFAGWRFLGVRFLSGFGLRPTPALWAVRDSGSLFGEIARSEGSDFGEHGPYVCNPHTHYQSWGNRWIRCHRSAEQVVEREFEDDAQTVRTGQPQVDANCLVTLRGNYFEDCGSFPIPITSGAPSGVQANGSDATVAGLSRGRVLYAGNVHVQTHQGGGMLFAGGDLKGGSFAKQGKFLTASGRALAKLIVDGNVFLAAHGGALAEAARPVAMLGSVDELYLGENYFEGDTPSLILNHTGDCGSTTVVGSGAPSLWPSWNGSGKAWTELLLGAGKFAKIADSALDAFPRVPFWV